MVHSIIFVHLVILELRSCKYALQKMCNNVWTHLYYLQNNALLWCRSEGNYLTLSSEKMREAYHLVVSIQRQPSFLLIFWRPWVGVRPLGLGKQDDDQTQHHLYLFVTPFRYPDRWPIFHWFIDIRTKTLRDEESAYQRRSDNAEKTMRLVENSLVLDWN